MPRVATRACSLLATVSSLAVVLASMVACSAGPSDRPAVALRGRDTAAASAPSQTGPRPLPPLDGHSTTLQYPSLSK